MKQYKDVIGSRESSQPIVIGLNHIYEHTNVREIKVGPEDNQTTMYQYDEIEYTKDEYLIKIINENKELSKKLNANESTLETLLTDMIPEVLHNPVNTPDDETSGPGFVE